MTNFNMHCRNTMKVITKKTPVVHKQLRCHKCSLEHAHEITIQRSVVPVYFSCRYILSIEDGQICHQHASVL